MAELISSFWKGELVRSIHRDIVNENDFYFVFLANTDDEDESEVADTQQSRIDIQRHLLGVKRVRGLDAILLIPRINWTSGEIYDRYDDTVDLTDRQFYVLTDSYRVYKCLGNAQDNFSSINPSSADPLLSEDPPVIVEKFQTSDEYWWQFMYEVPLPDREKFLTADYIPVRFYSSNSVFDYNGIVESITLSAGGSGYTSPPSVVISGDGYGAVGVAVLDGDEVVGVTIEDGGTGYSYAMVDFVGGGGSGATGAVVLETVNTPVDVNADVATYAAVNAGSIDYIDVEEGGADYESGDTDITITGDGSGAVASLVISGGAIQTIEIVNGGVGYTFADVSITSGSGVGAVARAVIGPAGGHGSNLPQELGAKVLGIVVSLEDDLSDLPMNNNFSIIGLVKNLRTANGDFFDGATGNPNYIVEVPDVGEYLEDDLLLTTSGGEFRVVSINSGASTISLQPIVDLISDEDTIENVRSAESDLEITSLEEPEFDKFTGTIIYAKNIDPITRLSDQAEIFKLYVTF